jgi:hypothetical protein
MGMLLCTQSNNRVMHRHQPGAAGEVGSVVKITSLSFSRAVSHGVSGMRFTQVFQILAGMAG